VIGPGWMPRWRPAIGKRTLAYRRIRRIRRRPRAARPPAIGHDEIVIFDQGPTELPTATLLPKSRGLALVAGLQRWLIARWSWLLPRAVPVIVATVGMILVLISADYLAHAHGDAGVQWSVRIVGP
jgi:hypothetical protein